MGTEKCPFCGQEIDTAATRCFFCGAELSEESVHKRLEQLHEQDARVARKVHSHIVVGIIIVIILIGIVFFYDTSGRKRISIDDPYQNSTLRLNAKVTYPGARFIISNNDSFDWINVKLEFVPESAEDRFGLRVPNISAGETYSAAAAEFLKKNGVRFNPQIMKPKKFWILCDTPTNQRGSYQAVWK
jgi:hypothetical protein